MPAYETAEQRKFKVYRQFLRGGKAKVILDAHQKAGGDAQHLWWWLWMCREKNYRRVVPDRRTLEAMQRLWHGLEAIPDMQGLKAVDEDLWNQVNELTALKPALEAYLPYLQRLPMTRKQIRAVLRPSGVTLMPLPKASEDEHRRRGRSPETLAAAVLVEELQRRFGKRDPKGSNYRRAMILLHEALPDSERFEDPTGPDAPARLSKLVRRVPREIIEREHASAFPQ